jgi:hypothetical protein
VSDSRSGLSPTPNSGAPLSKLERPQVGGEGGEVRLGQRRCRITNTESYSRCLSEWRVLAPLQKQGVNLLTF